MRTTEVSLVEKAIRVAVRAHQGQVRRVSKLPFFIHPMAVALKLAKHGFSDEVLAAALTHDVLEDTEYPPSKLKRELGEKVFNIVKTVTYDKRLSWDEERKRYLESVQAGSVEAKAVSIADKIHNLESILSDYYELKKSTWNVFHQDREKKIWFEEESLKMFKDSWDHPLIEEYEALLEEVKKLP
jgi:(p)ppGpp synthase/HD superfamily hydrolase